MRDIFSELIGDLDKDQTTPSTPAATEQNSFPLPEGARPFLPATIWEKLIGPETPRRGILLNALDRVRSVLYLISTYLPHHIVQQKMRRPVCGHSQGRIVRGTLLFSDVSGFTALSERLAILGNEGAEQLTEIMNGYFENMLEILAWSGGALLKFAGDATLIYFAEQAEAQQAQWAVRTGQRMMAAMAAFQQIDTPLGPVSLKMKIGISTGRFLEAHIGSEKRMEYVVIGRTVNQTMAAEGTAEAGMIVVDKATIEHLDPDSLEPHTTEFFRLKEVNSPDIGDFEVKAESRRARGSVPWNANPHAIAAQMEVAVRQINALTPYLARELVDNIVTNAKKRRIASEFRPTTIIFCNFIGFEAFLALWGNHGPRRIAKMLSQFFQTVHETIVDYGGVVTRIDPYSSGSKMLVLFGAPTAHEDDPQRAANAALAMQAGVDRLNQEWRQKYSRQLADKDEADENAYQVQLKIGITHGRTFAGQVGAATRREYTVMGDDVNLSARLMSAAKPGQILLNVPVYEQIQTHFITNKLEPIRVKGKSEPIPIFELQQRKAAGTLPQEKEMEPIFGRQQEIALGQSAIKETVQGRGRQINIQGPAGIGKSHLLEVLYSQSQAESLNIHLNYCHSFTAQSPYAVWISFIRSLAGIAESDSQESAVSKFELLLQKNRMSDEEYSRPLANLLGLRFNVQSTPPAPVPSSPAAASSKPAGGSSLFSQLGQKVSAQEGQPRSSLDLSKLTNKQSSTKSNQLWQRLQIQVASRERARLFSAIFHLLNQLAVQKPLLLLFENAQWLDPSSQELLDFIGPELEKVPILLLTIRRDSLISSQENTAAPLHIGPLSNEATAELIYNLLEEEPKPAVVDAIYSQSSGNPLYIKEITYWLQRNRQDGQSQDMTGSLLASISIQELILSRIDSLPPEARETLKTAAIIGNEFRLDTLQALLVEQKNEYDLSPTLNQLESRQLIARNRTENDLEGPPLYAFQQPLVREIIYNSQAFAIRRQSHHFLGTYLEDKHKANIEQQVDLLAYHYEKAEYWAKAGQYTFLTAQRARQRFAYPLAAETYQRAQAHLMKLSVDERGVETTRLIARCHEGQGDMALLMRELVKAASAYEKAVNFLSDAQQPIPPELHIKLAQTLPVFERAEESEAILRRLTAGSLSARQETAAFATLTWLLRRAENDEAAIWLERAKGLAEKRPNDGWVAGIMALLIEWRGDLKDALDAYQTFEQTAGIILTHCRLGDRFLRDGLFDQAKTHYRAALKAAVETAEEAGDPDKQGLALALFRQAELDWRQEKGTETSTRLQQALEKLSAENEAERKVILQALKLVEAGDSAVWPQWRWQLYDDAFRISLLFDGESDP